jgi:hypothetical protein
MCAGRRSKLTLEVRMLIRRRVQAWKGRRGVIYAALARENNVAPITIQRAYLGY